MDKLAKYKDSLTALKNDLFSMYLSNSENKDYEKLIKLENIDKNLHETLLVVHSNYITMYKENSNRAFTVVSRLLDSQLELIHHIEMLEECCEQHKQAKEKSTKEGGWLTNNNIIKLAVPVVGILVVLFIMHYISDSSFQAATDFFSSLIGLNSGGASK